jgi:hypothetical protein
MVSAITLVGGISVAMDKVYTICRIIDTNTMQMKKNPCMSGNYFELSFTGDYVVCNMFEIKALKTPID